MGECISLLVEKNSPYLDNSTAMFVACPSRTTPGKGEVETITEIPKTGDDGVLSSEPGFYGAVFDEENALLALPEKNDSHNEDDINDWETAWRHVYSNKSHKGRTQIATAMPCVEVNRRCDMTLDPLIAITRPVGREEMITNRDANRAMKEQWSVMHRRAWNFGEVRERCEVVKEAQGDNCEIRLGRIHGLCIETNSELPPGHPARQ